MNMIAMKREALSAYFQRELDIMLVHFKPSKGAKAKEKKKTYEKLSKIMDKSLPALENYKNLILDEYFGKVCYSFYKR